MFTVTDDDEAGEVDQRNTGSFGVSYDADVPGFWVSVTGRHESGTPLEVEDDTMMSYRGGPVRSSSISTADA